eukprot:SAG22_NODE_66_length_22936_cov_626.714279_15_plen_317_part_00
MPTIQKIKQWYTDSFRDLISIPPPCTLEDQLAFDDVCRKIQRRHAGTNTTMAMALLEFREEVLMKKSFTQNLADMAPIHEALDQFFLARIGIRVLMEHYSELVDQGQGDLEANLRLGNVGLICEATVASHVAEDAAEDAMAMCEREFGVTPEVDFLGSNLERQMAYIPSHLYYIMFELLKNSLRATVEHQRRVLGDSFDEDEHLPSIKVIIADWADNEDVVIKISDEGGGIKRSDMPRVFSYLFSTVEGQIQHETLARLKDFGTNSPIAGLGYGLGVARLYAQYFGGDLTIVPIEGYGTDAYVHLSRITNKMEPLP